MAGFLGMRGTGDWATDQRPKNWREMILYLYPNGSAPLTAIMSKMGSEKTDDPEYNWWTLALPAQGGAVSSIYVDAALATEYVYATHQATRGIAGQTLYAKVAEAVADEFREGHEVMLRDASRLDVDIVGKVTSVTKNGASSVIAVKLLEADDNSATSASYNLATVDTILIIGNINAEGAEIPDALSYNPTKVYNYTQIFRTPLEASRTALLTRLRTGDAYTELKRQALELHSIEMEKAFLWGIRTENTSGTNSKKERTTLGLIPAVVANNSSGVDDYTLNTSYSGATWEDGGEEWLDSYLEVIFRYGKNAKLAFVGSEALLGIQRLAKTTGQIELTPTSTDYGLQVTRWITAFGTINLMTHPLFSYEATNRKAMLIYEPQNLKFRYITDTTFYPDPNRTKKEAGFNKIDGIKEEFLTEGGLEYHHFETMGYLKGLGADSAV